MQTEATIGVDLLETRYGTLLVPRSDDTIGESLRRYGEWAQGEMTLLDRVLRPGMAVADIGANLGTHTLYFARMVGADGLVYAFEPQKFVFCCLAGSVALNGLSNVAAFNALVGDRHEAFADPQLDYTVRQNFGAVRYRKASPGAGSLLDVEMKRFDDYRIDRLDLLKIDAEGMEHYVLRGMTGTIARLTPTIYVETTTRNRAALLDEMLLPLGYRAWMHEFAAFNPRNFRGAAENIFGDATEKNVLYVHESRVPGLADVVASLPPFDRDTLPDMPHAV